MKDARIQMPLIPADLSTIQFVFEQEFASAFLEASCLVRPQGLPLKLDVRNTSRPLSPSHRTRTYTVRFISVTCSVTVQLTLPELL